MFRVPVCLLLCSLFLACQRDGPGGIIEAELDASIYNATTERLQVTLDTIGGRTERRFHRIPPEVNLVKLLNNDRVEVAIPAVDLVLRGDSVRLGIMQVTDWRPDFVRRDYADFPDHLLLTHYGTDTTNFVLDQANIRPITKQTVFRVGRHRYLLRSFDAETNYVSIVPVDDKINVPLSAQFDIRYRRARAVGLFGQPETIAHRKGYQLGICFVNLHELGGERIRELDTAYRAARKSDKEWDIALVNHSHSPASLRRAVQDNALTLPVYKSTASTCNALNCRPNLPYCLQVNTAGNVVSYYRPVEDIVAQLR